MKKALQAPFFVHIDSKTNIASVSNILDHTPKHAINISPWKLYQADVQVDFTLGRGADCFILKYYVSEPFSIPNYFKANDPVYKDSCVEFFIDFNDGAGYYNFEFNTAGTCLFGFGSGKERKLLPEAYIRQINYQRSFKYIGKDELICWELALIIPFKVFCFHYLNPHNNLYCKGNFFKCGDDLPLPHYLSWNNILSEQPNFHLPEFFGLIDFPIHP